MAKCEACMAFDPDIKKSTLKGLLTYGWCKRFQCWRLPSQGACDAFVGGGTCFLTTACVKHKGHPDDCAELTALRAFRDNYMKASKRGSALVEEYYAIAPSIVEKIDESKDSAKVYDEIYQVITQCVSLIKQERWEETEKAYTNMVDQLSKRFL